MNQALPVNHEQSKECFTGILKLLQDSQVAPPDAVSALMNVLVIVWAKEIGGAREDLIANVNSYFDRAEAFVSGQGSATQ